MYQSVTTAKLRDGVTGLRFYNNQSNFIAWNDVIEVRNATGTIITQPPIAGRSEVVIDNVIMFTASIYGTYITEVGFRWNNANSKWEGLTEANSSNNVIPTSSIYFPLSLSGTVGTILVSVSLGQLVVEAGIGVHKWGTAGNISIPYQIVNPGTPETPEQPTTLSKIPVINLNHFTSTTNAGEVVYSYSMQQNREVSIQILATNSPTAFTATNLPSGLTINNSGLIKGIPTSSGMFVSTITATNSTGSSVPKNLRFDVTAASSETGGGSTVVVPINPSGEAPTFIKNDGVDLFFDLQSRHLSLTPPKEETAISSDTKVINSLMADRLLIKTGETLWLNLRFVKGTTPLDPEATGLRFGVAGKLGGPLLMEGDSFTKVGSGSAAYYRMRVTAIENEFSAIIDDYYDEDAVEQISTASESQATSSGDIEGLCEVVLTTGSGENIAALKSDTLGVTLKRSIF